MYFYDIEVCTEYWRALLEGKGNRKSCDTLVPWGLGSYQWYCTCASFGWTVPKQWKWLLRKRTGAVPAQTELLIVGGRKRNVFISVWQNVSKLLVKRIMQFHCDSLREKKLPLFPCLGSSLVTINDQSRAWTPSTSCLPPAHSVQ